MKKDGGKLLDKGGLEAEDVRNMMMMMTFDDDDVYYPRGRRPKMMNDYGRLREATATTEREGATRAVRSDWGK